MLALVSTEPKARAAGLRGGSAARVAATLVATALSAACARESGPPEGSAPAALASVGAHADGAREGSGPQQSEETRRAREGDSHAGAPAHEAASAAARDLPSRFVEARRTTIRAPEDEPALAPFASRVRERFGDAAAERSLQATRIDPDRMALLVADDTRAEALLLVVERSGTELAWWKEQPLAGTRGGSTELALTAGPAGQVALAWCDASTRAVALRRWDHDGTPLADHHLLDVDVCGPVSAVHAPGRGFVVAAAQPGLVRGQRLDDEGALAWGRAGRTLATGRRALGAAWLAIDLEPTFLLVHRGEAGGPAAIDEPPHWLASRFDEAGARLWKEPLDLGPAPASRARPRLDRPKPGSVRVRVGGLDVLVTSTGDVTR